MKKSDEESFEVDEMLPEYDLQDKQFVRGKYHKAMQQGYSIHIQNEDGTETVRHVPARGTIILEPDVQEYFPDSESVNRALRSLIALIPKQRKPAKKVAAPRRRRKLDL